MVCTLRFFSSKCSLFHNSKVFGSCIIHILYTECAKIKKNYSGAKSLRIWHRITGWLVPDFSKQRSLHKIQEAICQWWVWSRGSTDTLTALLLLKYISGQSLPQRPRLTTRHWNLFPDTVHALSHECAPYFSTLREKHCLLKIFCVVRWIRSFLLTFFFSFLVSFLPCPF